MSRLVGPVRTIVCLLVFSWNSMFLPAQGGKPSQGAKPHPQAQDHLTASVSDTVLANPGQEGPGTIDSDVLSVVRSMPDVLQAAQLPQLFTGSMTWNVPISVPPGRGGIEPTLKLFYRSGSPSGMLGLGWTLDIGAPESVERNIRFGLDYGSDAYVLRSLGGTADLIAIGGIEFRRKIDSSFWRIRKLAGTDGKVFWELTDKNGTRFLYGETSASRQDNPSDQNLIFKWCLDKIQDTDGNYLAVTYSKTDGQIYLNRIDYTGNGNIGPSNSVSFAFENRSDAYPIYTTDFQVITRQRLKAIDLIGAGKRVRTYVLSYSQESSTGTSLLAAVQEYGSDSQLGADGTITSGSSLPPQLYAWSASPHGFTADLTSPDIDPGYAGGRAWVDFDGDGKADYCRLVGVENHVSSFVKCTLSTGTGFGQEIMSGVLDWGYPEGRAWVDFDGDGKADYCRLVGVENHVSSFVKCTLSAGTGFGQEIMSGVLDWGYPEGRAWVDFDGDGKADYCRLVGVENHVSSFVKCTLSTGTGFGQEIMSGVLDWGYPEGRAWVDFNGDGKADYCRLVGVQNLVSSFVQCTLSTGTGFGQTITSGVLDWGYPEGRAWVDFNGDGKADYCRIVGGAGNYHAQCTLSTGLSFGETYTSGVLDPGDPTTRYWVDLNGDGKADFCRLAAGNILKCLLSTGSGFGQDVSSSPLQPGAPEGRTMSAFTGSGSLSFCRVIPDAAKFQLQCSPADSGPGNLLAKISGQYGGSTTIAYTPSTSFSNSLLPFPIQTVTTISVDDGRNTTSNVNFSYASGFYSIPDREFRGFNYAKIVAPAGPTNDQAITETWFHQGNDTVVDVNNPAVPVGYLSGSRYRIRLSDPAGNKYAETTITYRDSTSPPYFNPPLQVDSYTCQQSSCAKHTQRRYDYDKYGNLTRLDDSGDVDIPADDFTVLRTFIPNENQWIVGKVASTSIYTDLQTKNKIAETDWIYDGPEDCLHPSSAHSPTKGHLTELLQWLPGTDGVEQRFGHDQTGNVSCSSDPNGNISRIAYDSSFVFPVQATDPKGLSVQYQYYGVSGTPADHGSYGQLARLTDLNGGATTYQYDVFGRASTLTLADGSSERWTYNSIGTPSTQHLEQDLPEGLVSLTYFDGLGRVWLTKRTGADGKLIVKQKQFGARGLITARSLPYFDGINPANIKWTNLAYDSAGRLIRAVQPDGATILGCYDYWKTGYIDGNGHLAVYTRDAFSRVTRIDEYKGTFSDCGVPSAPSYTHAALQYDKLGNLVSILDAQDHATLFTYDEVRRNTSIRLPDSGLWRFTYDRSGNLLQQQDPIGNTLRYDYDVLNRPIDLKGEDNHGRTSLIASYTYDADHSNDKGRLASIRDHVSTTTFDYDVIGRVSRKVVEVGSKAYPTKRQYDLAGRLRNLTYPDGTTLTYSYNGVRLATISSPQTTYVEYSSFNEYGLPALAHYGNGVSSRYTYANHDNPVCPLDDFRLCTIQTSDNSGNVIQNMTYRHNPGGNITAINDPINGDQSFAYDELDRLVSARGSYGTYEWEYDIIGNIVKTTPLGDYRFGLTGPHQVSQIQKVKYSYDSNGNTVQIGNEHISYNVANRQYRVAKGSHWTTVSYYGDGAKAERRSGFLFLPLHSTVYLGPDYSCIRDLFKRARCEAHLYDGRRLVADISASSSDSAYYHVDQVGSTLLVTDRSGKTKEVFAYSPYGGMLREQGTAHKVEVRFSGQELDRSTGQYHFPARFYSPSTGLFLSPDPTISNLYSSGALNPYSYVLNNPVNLIDPSGYDAEGDGDGRDDSGGDDDSKPSGGGCDPSCGHPSTSGPDPAPKGSGDISDPKGSPQVSDNKEKPDDTKQDSGNTAPSPARDSSFDLGSRGDSSHVPSARADAITPTVSPIDALAAFGGYALARYAILPALGALREFVSPPPVQPHI